MDRQQKISLLIIAGISIATVLALSYDYLERRLGNYLLIYSAVWALVVFLLLLVSFRFLWSASALRLILAGVFIGYLSSVLAYVFAVVLDVSNIRTTHRTWPIEALIIPFVFPFIVLRGWMFTIVFVPLALLLNHYKSKQKQV